MNQVFYLDIYPSALQEQRLRRYFMAHRFVYNYFRDIYAAAYERNGSRFDVEVANSLLARLIQKTPALQELNFLILQCAHDDINSDFMSFYQADDPGATKKAMPRRLSDNMRPGCKISAEGYNVHYDREWIYIHGIGQIPHDGTWLEGVIRQLTISRPNPGHYVLIAICDDHVTRHYNFTGQAVGIVRSQRGFATASTGKHYSNAPEIEKLRGQLLVLNQQMGHANHKSENSLTDEQKVLRKALTQENKKFVAHLSTHFIKNNDRIYIESMDEHLFEQNLLSAKDYLWKIFLEQLERKADQNERIYLEIDSPPKMLCSSCGQINSEVPGSASSWSCSQCNATQRCEINCAQNVLQLGERLSWYEQS